jgi:hypothetical protein
LVHSGLGHNSMALTCGYSSPRSTGQANPQVTEVRVQVPLGHKPFGHVRRCQSCGRPAEAGRPNRSARSTVIHRPSRSTARSGLPPPLPSGAREGHQHGDIAQARLEVIEGIGEPHHLGMPGISTQRRTELPQPVRSSRAGFTVMMRSSRAQAKKRLRKPATVLLVLPEAGNRLEGSGPALCR